MIPVSEEVLESARPGYSLALDDTREKTREFKILSCSHHAVLAEARQTCYFETGARLRLLDRSGDPIAKGRIGILPEISLPISLADGDDLILVRDGKTGRHAVRDDEGNVLKPARIPCSPDAIFDCVKHGDRIFFDDGKIGGIIESCTTDEVRVHITRAGIKGGKLRPGKSINLPDTDLRIGALTKKDLADLALVARHSDMVGLSFARTPEDALDLQSRLRALGADKAGLVLNIETRAAFDNLPRLLLAGQQWPSLGILVGRGDLAVEIGVERLSEVQEEILRLCEAAHVPVIRATQVLETLARSVSPSRTEVTDSATGGNAGCAMLGKGPHLTQAVRFLCDVLDRAEPRHEKIHHLLRKLSIADIHAPAA